MKLTNDTQTLLFTLLIGGVLCFWIYRFISRNSNKITSDSKHFVKPDPIFMPIELVYSKDELGKLLQAKKGTKIHKVIYTFANEFDDFDFDILHKVDYCISLQFDNGQWLNWIWMEGDYDEVVGHLPEGFYLNFDYPTDNLEATNFTLIDVTDHPKWTTFISSEVTVIEAINAESSTINFTDLMISNSNETITFCATIELLRKELENELQLPHATDRTAVVFDETVLRESKRGKFLGKIS
jgi:hypothetical protein